MGGAAGASTCSSAPATRAESRRGGVCILARMQEAHALLARLLYGTGMRIGEALQLRVKDVDFSHQALIVREGKGGKDRVLMLAQSLAQPLRDQVRRFARQHRKARHTSHAAPLLRDALASRRIRHPQSSGPARTRRHGNDHDLHTRIEDGRRRCAQPARRAGCSRATLKRTWMSVRCRRQQPLERPQVAPLAKSRIGINCLCRGSNSRRLILKFS